MAPIAGTAAGVAVEMGVEVEVDVEVEVEVEVEVDVEVDVDVDVEVDLDVDGSFTDAGDVDVVDPEVAACACTDQPSDTNAVMATAVVGIQPRRRIGYFPPGLDRVPIRSAGPAPTGGHGSHDGAMRPFRMEISLSGMVPGRVPTGG